VIRLPLSTSPLAVGIVHHAKHHPALFVLGALALGFDAALSERRWPGPWWRQAGRVIMSASGGAGLLVGIGEALIGQWSAAACAAGVGVGVGSIMAKWLTTRAAYGRLEESHSAAGLAEVRPAGLPA
jgi:hypothetical protein